MKKSLLDPAFRYTPSYGTDIRKTFQRVRREQSARPAERIEVGHKTVVALRARKAGSE
jgi:hypothetical protein